MGECVIPVLAEADLSLSTDMPLTEPASARAPFHVARDKFVDVVSTCRHDGTGQSVIDLPAGIARSLVEAPEAGMGYHIVTVVLRNGATLQQGVVVNGRITGFRAPPSVPFVSGDIKQVIVTNDKWDFSDPRQFHGV
jgi:hypothetical protein